MGLINPIVLMEKQRNRNKIKVSQPISGRTEIQIQVCFIPKHPSPCCSQGAILSPWAGAVGICPRQVVISGCLGSQIQPRPFNQTRTESNPSVSCTDCMEAPGTEDRKGGRSQHITMRFNVYALLWMNPIYQGMRITIPILLRKSFSLAI